MRHTNSFVELSEGVTVSGLLNTLHALNDGQVRRLIMSANHTSGRGWQCRDCLALYVGVATGPENCVYCASTKICAVDLKAAMIARAFQLGCAIEVMSRSPEPEREVGALLPQRLEARPLEARP